MKVWNWEGFWSYFTNLYLLDPTIGQDRLLYWTASRLASASTRVFLVNCRLPGYGPGTKSAGWVGRGYYGLS